MTAADHPAGTPLRRMMFSDSDGLAEAFASWGMELTQLSRESDTAWTASGALENLTVTTTALTGRYRVRTGLPPSSVLLQLDLGSARSRRLGNNILAADDLLVGFAGAEIDGVLTEGHHGMSFVMPLDLITEALELRAPEAFRQVARPASAYVLSNSASKVAELRRLAGDAFGPSKQDRVGPLDRGMLLDSLIDALVEPLGRDTASAFYAPRCHCLPVVRRVEEFMRHNLGQQLMLHDLCRAARASQRTVEYAFSKCYGVGPKQYLRLLRLNEVRRVLKSRAGDSIGGTARGHGFWHLGHFFTDYRNLFGETPNQTRLTSR